jgi:hypothetical protein
LNKFKSIFGIVNLALFILSLCLTAFSALNDDQADAATDNHHLQFVQKHSLSTDGPVQQLSEENETETETKTDVEIQPIILPFLVSSLDKSFQRTLPRHTVAASSIPSQPIYLGVCNFRV